MASSCTLSSWAPISVGSKNASGWKASSLGFVLGTSPHSVHHDNLSVLLPNML